MLLCIVSIPEIEHVSIKIPEYGAACSGMSIRVPGPVLRSRQNTPTFLLLHLRFERDGVCGNECGTKPGGSNLCPNEE